MKKIVGVIALVMCLTMLCSCTSAHNAVNDAVRENFGSEAAEIHDEAWRQSQFVMEQAKDEMKDEFAGLKGEFQKLLEDEVKDKLVDEVAGKAMDGVRDQLNQRGWMLFALQQKFPDEKYWNRMGKDGKNNQHGWTDEECPAGHSATCNGFDPDEDGKNELSWQCMGFAERLGMDFSGSNPRDNSKGSAWTTYTSREKILDAIDEAKAGDIVRFYVRTGTRKDGTQYEVYHSIFLTKVDGEDIYFADCNETGRCQIRWGGHITREDLRKKTFQHYRVAPFEVK